ncbi:MAG: hypothetical protein WBQ25_11995 [Nitrososphaeraceae archaeon]
MNLYGRKSITIFMIIAAVIITFGSITPLTGAEVFAKSSAYQSGYDHGVSGASGMNNSGPTRKYHLVKAITFAG